MGLETGIIGHSKQLEALTRALEGGKVPHAYLFTGIGGIGKKRVAINLAKALQCTASWERPCNHCSGCEKTESGIHPDVTLLERDGNYIKIEQIRTLQKQLGYKPFEGKATVCIIDGADFLNIAAANALLKTLEEPPPATHLILVAENVRQVIPTILSRCQRLNFHPLSTEDIVRILVAEKDVEGKDAKAVAKIAEGSAAKAFGYLESFSEEEREALIGTIWDIKSVEDVFSTAEKLTNKDNLERLTEMLEMVKFFLRDAMLIKTGLGQDRLISMGNFEAIKKSASAHSLSDLLSMADKISKTEAALMMNANKKLTVETMLLGFYEKRRGVCS